MKQGKISSNEQFLKHLDSTTQQILSPERFSKEEIISQRTGRPSEPDASSPFIGKLAGIGKITEENYKKFQASGNFEEKKKRGRPKLKKFEETILGNDEEKEKYPNIPYIILPEECEDDSFKTKDYEYPEVELSKKQIKEQKEWEQNSKKDNLGIFGITDNITLDKKIDPTTLGITELIKEDKDIEDKAKVILTSKQEQKLNNLASILSDILSGDKEALQNPEFTCLGFENIRLALQWLLDNNRLSSFVQNELVLNPWRVIFRAKPPRMEDFLTYNYIGPQAEALYPWVKEGLVEGFNPSKPYRTIILVPYIGFGKSTASILGNLFVSSHNSLMWSQYKYYGHAPTSVYAQVYFSGTLKRSSEILFEPMMQLLESASFFERMRTKTAMQQAIQEFEEEGEEIKRIPFTTASPTSSIEFAGGSRYKLISSPAGLLGTNIVTATMTEVSFLQSEFGWSSEKIFRSFSKIRGRIESRFKGNYYSRLFIDSSPDSLENPIDDWVWNDAPKSKNNYIVSGSRWFFNKQEFPDYYDKGFDQPGNPEKAFYIYKGGNGELPAVLEKGQEVFYSKVDLVEVPKVTIDNVSMEELAKENVIEFLKDQAGIPAGAADRIFYNPQLVENIFSDKLKNHYYFIKASSKENPEHLIWDQIKNIFFRKMVNTYYYWYAPELPRTISIDLSVAEDMTGISAAHVERDPSKIDPETGQSTSIYVVDFTICIVPDGNRINLEAVRCFITDLITLGNFPISYVSFDRHQSETTVQNLQRRGINVEYLSVDRTNDPYYYFINMVEKGRVKCGRNIILKNNLLSLQMQKRKPSKRNPEGTTKIEHIKGDVVYTPPNNYDFNNPSSYVNSWKECQTGAFGKDLADAVCASIELIRKYNFTPSKIWKEETIMNNTPEEIKAQTKDYLKSIGFRA